MDVKQSYCFSNSYQITQTHARALFWKGTFTLDFWLKKHKIEVFGQHLIDYSGSSKPTSRSIFSIKFWIDQIRILGIQACNLQLTLTRAVFSNANDFYLFLMIFPRISLHMHCKLQSATYLVDTLSFYSPFSAPNNTTRAFWMGNTFGVNFFTATFGGLLLQGGFVTFRTLQYMMKNPNALEQSQWRSCKLHAIWHTGLCRNFNS